MSHKMLRKYNSDVHVYRFNPKDERMDIERGIPDKLEYLSQLGKPASDEEVTCKMNWQFFELDGTPEGYGEFFKNGKQELPESKNFATISLSKDNKLVFGKLPDNEVLWRIGSSCSLVLNGKKALTNTQAVEAILKQRHPRSAVGQAENGDIIMVKVEGRNTNGLDSGVTGDELAQIMLDEGCIIAAMGDGGGSSVMIALDSSGKLSIVSESSDIGTKERRIGTGFIIYRKKRSGSTMGKYVPKIEKSAYISPSTQEGNIGAGKYGTEERVMNLVADVVIPILEYNGITCYRNTPQMTHVTAMQDSNKKMPGIHFAIHSNATGKPNNTSVRGCEVFICPGSVNGRKLAQAVYDRMSALTPVSDRGVKEARYTELTDTLAPAALIEIDFHDNLDGAAWILQNIEAIGKEIALGICDYFGIAGKLPEQVLPCNISLAIELLTKALELLKQEGLVKV